MNLTSSSRRSAAAGWHGDSIPLALVCASIFLIGACGAVGTRSSGATITRLDGTTIDTTALTQRIEALTRAANVHGLTVTIFNGAERVYARAFGVANLPAGKPLRTDTELYGASLSKAVFSVLVMKLVEQGVLDLDKPLQEYVSEPLWQNRGTSWHEDLSDLRSDPRYRRITARMSMSHTTGLPGWRWFEPDQKLRIHSEPGERFIYSGEGMTLLQVVIEKVTGKPLEELMQEHLFEPYGMSTSSYTWQPRFEADYAVGHAPDGKVYPKDKDNAARAPSTLETTTDDYARFMTAVLCGEGLSEASWNEMFKPQVGIRSRTLNHMDDIPQVDRLVNELNSSDPSGQRNADRFDEWITILRGKGGSDLYLVAGVPPSIRIHGIVQPLPEATLDGEEIEASVLPALPRHAAEQYRKTGCADASFRRASDGRFRINLHRERGRAAASIRALPLHPPTRRTGFATGD